ncbi:hypothetical protein PY650_35655 [Rhizobium calliandrae]|uniref:PNPLA domain-containing protein n=1 Tax=Rhizobium calliandrae TaxID=1312182 RepID=A0ABT7KQ84_9HYPH|nr:hypothetical protein [Rhizobium calliandrae]MDL2410787.1 hypothetical protein [Rhizobium calliandrae]
MSGDDAPNGRTLGKTEWLPVASVQIRSSGRLLSFRTFRWAGKMQVGKAGREFQIGLAMAGAISAGAYSAGVFDFLIQALNAWQKAKDDPANKDAIPNHTVGIKVIAGASAGAITGALGAVALAGGVTPVKFEGGQTGNAQLIKYLLPNLYDAWVVRPTMLSQNGGEDFLRVSDLDGASNVVSVLNSKVLSEIEDAALRLDAIGEPYPYISSSLEIYLTVSNLRGVPYSVSFRGGDYGMMNHGDRIHYRIEGLGTWDSPSRFAQDDKVRKLNVQDLRTNGGKPSAEWVHYGLAAVTSGAFPIGLAARQWNATSDEYEDRNWPITDAQLVKDRMKPAWPESWHKNPSRAFAYTAVDGGLINNEPFEFARYCLMETPGQQNPRSGDDADRAVIMIDPFPEAPPFPQDGEPAGDLISVLMTLIPALRTQTQFKPAEVAVAAVDGIFSRFLISPHRTAPDGTEQVYALASGLLGGFGGFLAQTFREHDYQLGRRNCQKFLSESFGLYEDNEIIKAWPEAARSNAAFHGAVIDEKQIYRIIPLLGDALPEVPYPTWPQIDDGFLGDLQNATELRISKLAAASVAQKGPTWFLRRLMEIAYSFEKERLFDFVRFSLLSDLVRRDQLASWKFPVKWKRPSLASEQEIRLVLAELLSPKFELRNEAGIAKATGLDIGKVRDILATCQAETNSKFAVWRAGWTDKAGGPLFALVSRKPTTVWRLPGIRQIGNWFTVPSVDPPGV